MNMYCETIINEYIEIIKKSFDVVKTTHGCRLVTPILRPDGEAVEIVVHAIKNEKYYLSDDYLTLDYLFVNGICLEDNFSLYTKAQDIAKLRGVHLENSEIFIEASVGELGQALYNLLDTIEAITYFIYRRTHRERKSFTEEVELYLLENHIGLETSYFLHGRTAEHTIPIFVNSSKNVAVSPMSTTSVSIAKKESKIFGFMVRDVRDLNEIVHFAAVLDDRKAEKKRPWDNEDVHRILVGHADHITSWSNKEDLLRVVNLY